MKKTFPRAIALAVTAAFLFAGCDGSASPDVNGRVDGFLVRANEKPGSGSGQTASPHRVTVKSLAPDPEGDGGIFYKGETVFIYAGALSLDSYVFLGWKSKDNNITFADQKSLRTTFIMPASDVEVEANWVRR